MAIIYVQCEKFDEAIAEIDYLLSLESIFTVNNFNSGRIYQPLHDIPEFQALMEKYALRSGI